MGLYQVARIVYECVTLIVPPSSQQLNSGLLPHRSLQSKSNRKDGFAFRSNDKHLSKDHQLAQLLSPKLLRVRKIILQWCLNSFATVLHNRKDRACNDPALVVGKKLKKKQAIRTKSMNNSKMEEGAGAPDYSSVLDGITTLETSIMSSSFFMKTLRCLLFIEKPVTKDLSTFLALNFQYLESDRVSISEEKAYQIQVCCDYGVDIDNEVIRIILDAVGSPKSVIDASVAIFIIEQLFYQCRDGQHGVLRIDDYKIIWDLYNLTEYTPEHLTAADRYTDSDTEEELDVGKNSIVKESNIIPRLVKKNLENRSTLLYDLQYTSF